MLTTLFALIGGILTIAAPCTLPVLPILLGASIGHTSKSRPIFIVIGFVFSFAAVALLFSAIPTLFGIEPTALRNLAAILLFIFGAFMLWPTSFEWLTSRISGLLPASANEPRNFSGNTGAFMLGTTLGLVWTPCAGPVLASILTLIAASEDFKQGAALLVVYAIGAAVPMLGIAYGGQAITTRVKSVARVSHRLMQGFGVAIIFTAIAIYFEYDTLIAAWFSQFYPGGVMGF